MNSTLRKIYHTPLVKKTVIAFVSVIYPPPYRRNLMEFEFDIWSGIASLHCENKRQLGESNTCPAFYREYIPAVYHKSNIDDSRAGHVINMTALHEVMRQWRNVLALVGAIRHSYMERFGISHKELRPADLYILSKICIALPAFLVRRAQNPVRDGKIPADVAAQYKVTAGIFMVFRKMMEDGVRWSEPDRLLSAEELYDYADSHNVLISPSGLACGGTKRKIIELIDLMIKGDEVDKKNLPEGEIRLAGLVGEVDDFLGYSVRAITLETLIALSRSIVAKVFLNIDLNFLQNREHKELVKAHAEMCDQIKRMFNTSVKLNCQIEVLYALLEDLGHGRLGNELKRRLGENGREYVAGLVQHTPHLPESYRKSFAEAVRVYREVLDFLCEAGGVLQNEIFSTLGRAKAVRFSVCHAERGLGIVNRRRLERIVRFNVNGGRVDRIPLKI